MKKVLLATAAVLGFVGAASAADLRPLPARPVVVPVFNWTSCYIGGYVGGAWGAENVRVLDVNGYNLLPVRRLELRYEEQLPRRRHPRV